MYLSMMLIYNTQKYFNSTPREIQTDILNLLGHASQLMALKHQGKSLCMTKKISLLAPLMAQG